MTTRISVNVEEDVERDAQRVLGEIGIDMTTAINSFLRAIVREERIPYELRTKRAYLDVAEAHDEYIRSELAKAKLEAADPNTRWAPHDEVMAGLRRRREARSHV